ncbi:S41 family peptidase, partial [Mesomycoplasma ovipneumoniae]|uniref:S41 family peptidase n=1 Tax=Mesomycoplasma ovipneumoniae TaxID=29562 RepID=UPI003CC7DC74
EQISQLLSREYYDKDSLLSGQQAMIESATKAFVEGLGDPFTSYLDAEQFSGLQSELEGDGQIEGIGAVVSKKDYYVPVEELVKDSPAFKAGLMPLDRIILIWTGETKELTTSEAVSQIRGPKGSTVELFIERLDKDGQKSYLEKQVVRDIIDVPSVRSKILTQSGIQLWYLEVSVFGDQTNK